MKKKFRNMAVAVLCFCIAIPFVSQASEGLHVESKTFQSSTESGTYDFQRRIEVDGVRYKLKDVEYKVVSQQYKQVAGKVEHIESSSEVPAGSKVSFDETIVIDDVTYTLKEVMEKPATEHLQSVTTYTDYEYKVDKNSVPDSKEVTVTNDKTSLNETVKCNLSDISFIENRWVDSHIDIQFKDYNSTSFLWQGLKIANNLNEMPLLGYEKELLASVELKEENGQVLKTYWTSDAFEKDGILYRNARADIKKLVPVYRANYEGEVRTEMMTYEAVYVGDGMVDSDELEYTIEANATYELENSFAYVLSAAVFILLIILIIVAIMVTNKKSKQMKQRKTHKQ